MKITISDMPLDKHERINMGAVSDEQYKRLSAIGTAFRSATNAELRREIEAVKIEAAYIDWYENMIAIRFSVAFNPFLEFKEHHSTGIIKLYALWEKVSHTMWYNDDPMISQVYGNFPHYRSRALDLTTDSPEEIADHLLGALAGIIEDTNDSLRGESKHLEKTTNRIRDAILANQSKSAAKKVA